jgi:hypothetical protein
MRDLIGEVLDSGNVSLDLQVCHHRWRLLRYEPSLNVKVEEGRVRDSDRYTFFCVNWPEHQMILDGTGKLLGVSDPSIIRDRAGW